MRAQPNHYLIEGLTDEAFLYQYSDLKYSAYESEVCKSALRRFEKFLFSKDELFSLATKEFLADRHIDDLDGLKEFIDRADAHEELLYDLCDLINEKLKNNVHFSELISTVKDLLKEKD